MATGGHDATPEEEIKAKELHRASSTSHFAFGRHPLSRSRSHAPRRVSVSSEFFRIFLIFSPLLAARAACPSFPFAHLHKDRLYLYSLHGSPNTWEAPPANAEEGWTRLQVELAILLALIPTGTRLLSPRHGIPRSSQFGSS